MGPGSLDGEVYPDTYGVDFTIEDYPDPLRPLVWTWAGIAAIPEGQAQFGVSSAKRLRFDEPGIGGVGLDKIGEGPWGPGQIGSVRGKAYLGYHATGGYSWEWSYAYRCREALAVDFDPAEGGVLRLYRTDAAGIEATASATGDLDVTDGPTNPVTHGDWVDTGPPAPFPIPENGWLGWDWTMELDGEEVWRIPGLRTRYASSIVQADSTRAAIGGLDLRLRAALVTTTARNGDWHSEYLIGDQAYPVSSGLGADDSDPGTDDRENHVAAAHTGAILASAYWIDGAGNDARTLIAISPAGDMVPAADVLEAFGLSEDGGGSLYPFRPYGDT
jgi:hypothetical protein